MASAIEAVKNNSMGYLLASNTYGVPKTTLIRRVSNQNKIAVGTKKFLGNKKSIIPEALENKFHAYILEM